MRLYWYFSNGLKPPTSRCFNTSRWVNVSARDECCVKFWALKIHVCDGFFGIILAMSWNVYKGETTGILANWVISYIGIIILASYKGFRIIQYDPNKPTSKCIIMVCTGRFFFSHVGQVDISTVAHFGRPKKRSHWPAKLGRSHAGHGFRATESWMRVGPHPRMQSDSDLLDPFSSKIPT